MEAPMGAIQRLDTLPMCRAFCAASSDNWLPPFSTWAQDVTRACRRAPRYELAASAGLCRINCTSVTRNINTVFISLLPRLYVGREIATTESSRCMQSHEEKGVCTKTSEYSPTRERLGPSDSLIQIHTKRPSWMFSGLWDIVASPLYRVS